MAVNQLKDGRWIVQYPNPEPPPKTKREYFGRGPEAEAAARVRNRELGIRTWERRKPAKKIGIQVWELAEAWRLGRFGHMEASTDQSSWYKVNRNLMPEFGRRYAVTVTHADLDRYVRRRLSSPVMLHKKDDRGRPVKVVAMAGDGRPRMVKRSTVRRELADLLAMFSYAKDRKLILTNPLEGYKLPKKDSKAAMPATVAEIEALLTHAAPHLARAVTLAYYTGARVGGEILGLQWIHVDFRAQVIMITSAMKGGPLVRLVPLHADLLEYLQVWRREDPDGQAHIVHYKGRPIRSFKTAFASAKKKAGITRRLRPYDIRHQFATYLIPDGDLKAISEMMGHSRVDTTMNEYQLTTSAHHRAQINRLPALGNTLGKVLPKVKLKKGLRIYSNP